MSKLKKDSITKRLLENEDGSDAISTVIAFSVVFGIVLSLAYGGYEYYSKSAENTNINYDVGRYLSTMQRMDLSTVETLKNLPQYDGFLIVYIDMTGTATTVRGPGQLHNNGYSGPPKGKITINANTQWGEKSFFGVGTMMYARPFQTVKLFEKEVYKGGVYAIQGQTNHS